MTLIQTVTIKLSNGASGQFTGPVIVDEATPREVEVVDVVFSTPRPAPYGVKILLPEPERKRRQKHQQKQPSEASVVSVEPASAVPR